ncbi:MAG TPA: hypothetical protein VG308_13875 [Stellaceae bacterium]|nr:hypothetical protein [Stellaceae bacterium]
MRDRFLQRLGAALAVFALGLQFALAGGEMAIAAPADVPDGLAAHALCLAGGAPPAAPSDSTPIVPAHRHGALCCLWHQVPGVAPQAAQAPRPVVYAWITHDAPGATPPVITPPRGPLNARGPPALG